LYRGLANIFLDWVASNDPAEQTAMLHAMREHARRIRREREEAERMGFVRTENGDAHCERTEGKE